MERHPWVVTWLLCTAVLYAGVWLGRLVHEWRAVRSVRRSLMYQAERKARLLGGEGV